MFTHLKALKVEIEHLQLLMDKAKVKLQKEFEAWWAEEAASLQVLAAMPLTAPEPTLLLGPEERQGSQGGAGPPAPWWGGAEEKEWGLRPAVHVLSAPTS